MLQLAALLGLLGGLAVKAQIAGNEDYANQARRSLHKSLDRRGSQSILTFSPASTSFILGNKTYISPTGSEFKQYKLDFDWGLDAYTGDVIPVTVFDLAGEVTCDVLSQKVEEYSQVDDVWDPGWGGRLIIKNGNATSNVSDIGLAHVKGASVPPGPYLAKVDRGLSLTEIYLTYRDEAQAFTTAAIQTTNGSFVDLSTPVLGLNVLSIPVPSRLYTKYLANPRPLEGLRIAVKDLFDLAGLKTGGGSRAYFNTYPVKAINAVAIQRVIDQGGIIVGRAKTSQFANGETATADWVDQMCPFNPRGDGYQQPSSSSSGPGAAQAAYDWIDHTIGSDTGGSITGPATVNGVYGLRPTWGAISLEGAIPLQPTQDTAGFFSRSAADGAEFARGWYGAALKEYTSFPTNLILPNSSWTLDPNDPTTAQFETFKAGLIDLLKPTAIDDRDFDGFWNTSGYFEKVGNKTVSTLLATTYADLITHYQWNYFGKPWFEDYASQNDGRVPFVDPSPLARWQYGQNVTEAKFNTATANKATWKEFVDTQVLVSDNVTCSNAIYVTPIGFGSVNYRNLYRSAPSVPLGFGYQAQFSGVPQLVLPMGQVAYSSNITNHTEYLPLAVTFFAANGCDYMLWDLAAALERAGVTEPVAAGTLAYPNKI